MSFILTVNYLGAEMGKVFRVETPFREDKMPLGFPNILKASKMKF